MATERIDLLRRLMAEEMLKEDLKTNDGKADARDFKINDGKADAEELSTNDSKNDALMSDMEPSVSTTRFNEYAKRKESNRSYSSSEEGYALGPREPKKPTKPKKKIPCIGSVADQGPQNRSVGELAPVDMKFVPILAAAKYPYKFMGGPPSVVESVSQQFFAHEKFWRRRWTIYYIYPPPSVSIKPLHLVPSSEVEALIDEINEGLKLRLKLPSRAEERGFLLMFPDNAQVRPHFLGISSTREAFNVLEKQTPADEFLAQKFEDSTTAAAFFSKMNLAFLSTRNKSKPSKDAKMFKRVQQKDVWCRQLRRTQCFLGLRPRSKSDTWSAPEPPSYMPGTTFEEYMKEKEEFEQNNEQPLPDLHPDVQAPFPFDDNVVFVSVDVEAYEKNHAIITEIGISSIDTNQLQSIPPGVEGKNWMKCIKSRHLRINEAVHLVNRDFINGCPERFEKIFGESEFISRKDAPQVIASCFRPPFAARDPRTNDGFEHTGSKRRIVLVGHDIKTDIQYLRELGYDIRNLSNMVEIIDTADLYRVLKYHDQPASLGILLNELGLSAWNLHNAGNDAAYTLQALIGITFRSLTPKAGRVPAIDALDTEDMSKEVANRIVEERKEWDAADKGLGDGGQSSIGL